MYTVEGLFVPQDYFEWFEYPYCLGFYYSVSVFLDVLIRDNSSSSSIILESAE